MRGLYILQNMRGAIHTAEYEGATVDNVIGVGKNFYVNFNALLNFS